MSLLEAAQRAYDTVPFYRELYGDRPETPERIPFIGDADFHRAGGWSACLTPEAEVAWSLSPFHRHGRRFPWAAVEDGQEEEWRQQRLVAALGDLGLAPGERDRVFLLVADESCGPFACELVAGLAWERHQASLAYVGEGDEGYAREVAAHRPDFLVVVSRLAPLSRLVELMGPGRVVRVERSEEGGAPPLADCHGWLVNDQTGLIATRRAGVAGWLWEGGQLLMETDPASGLSHLTTLSWSARPLIRYNLGMVVARREEGA